MAVVAMTKGTMTTDSLKSHTAQQRCIYHVMYHLGRYGSGGPQRAGCTHTISNCDRNPAVLRMMSLTRRIPLKSLGGGRGNPD